MATAHFVKKARKSYKEFGIKKGDSYYWWKFRYGGKYMSKERPRQSQLTQSAFLSQVYAIGESIDDFQDTDPEAIESFIQDVVSQLEDLKSECEEKLDAMPDQLRDSSSSGELLQSRVDDLDSMISDLEGIDCSCDDEPDRKDFEDDDEYETAIQEWESAKENILEELHNVSYSGS